MPILSLFVLLFSSIEAHAAPSSITAQELYDALTSKYNLSEWTAAKKSAVESRLKQGTAWENPVVQYGVGKATVGSFSGNYREWSISQTIPLNGQRSAKRRQLPLEQKITDLEGNKINNQVHGEVIKMIFFHMYNVERAHHIEERLQRLELISTYLQKKKFASPKDLVEKAQIVNRIKHLRIEVVHVQNDLSHSMTYFKNLADVTESTQIQTTWPEIAKLKDAFEQYLNNDTRIEEQREAELQSHDAELRAAKSLWVPDLRVYYMQTFQDQFLQEPNVNDAFGIGLSVPLFSWGRNAVSEKRALLITKKMERNKEKIERSSALLQLKNRFFEAKATLSEFNDAYIKKAEKDLDQATVSFKNGLVPAANYLDLEDQIHESVHLISKSKLEMIESTVDLIFTNNIDTDFKALFL
ncbi:MAG: TolC family protein [Bdellovibrionaceae bacterium]|nr:TolC family protein [Pseudobdellovibrionaceae bacterium]